jgi:hypothetical protein
LNEPDRHRVAVEFSVARLDGGDDDEDGVQDPEDGEEEEADQDQAKEDNNNPLSPRTTPPALQRLARLYVIHV